EVNGVEKALRACYKAKCEPVYMRQLVDARINSPKESPVWRWHTTPSVQVTGKTKQGTPVVVYAHVPNFFSKPNNVTKVVNEGLTNGAGKMPLREFYKLLDLEDKQNVFVVDYTKLKNSPSGVIEVARALEHPQTVSFLGGQVRAEQYLAKHQQVYNTSKIGVWHYDDLLLDQPLGRVLFLGGSRNSDLSADYNLYGLGRFLGVRRRGANGVSIAPVAQARENPGLDDIMKSVKNALEPLYR
ncbi:MAG: hypothetical protein Q8R47_04290, partial [Nanoarchaeota archaeon]|nr:hypothetical protein [Nanoarchaeota archaeon]